MNGTLDGHLREGRQDRPPQAQCRPRRTRTPTAAADAQGPGAAAGAQCRAPDDHRRRARSRGHADRRGAARCRGHRALRAAATRSIRTTGAIYVVKPKMHGPDEVAFACEIFGAVETDARPRAQHASRSASWTRSGAPPPTSRPRIHAARAAGVLHQHRLPRSHRRRDPHLDGGGSGAAQGRVKSERWIQSYEDRNVLIGLACGLLGPGADRQGHVGAARRHGGDAGEAKAAHPNAGANTTSYRASP